MPHGFTFGVFDANLVLNALRTPGGQLVAVGVLLLVLCCLAVCCCTCAWERRYASEVFEWSDCLEFCGRQPSRPAGLAVCDGNAETFLELQSSPVVIAVPRPPERSTTRPVREEAPPAPPPVAFSHPDQSASVAILLA